MYKQYSVLMSLYEKEKGAYLIESIESMLQQTVKPSEIIIVLDGYITNELRNVLDFYEKKYPNIIQLLPLEKNIGLGRALDYGLQFCTNELVARMDTDDISLPKRCEKQLKAFGNDEKLAIIGTIMNEFYDDYKNVVSSRIVPTENEDIVRFMKRRSPFNHPTVMFKKSVVLKCGGYGEFKRKQDLDLFSRIINNDYKALNLPEPLLLFRSNINNFKRRKSWTYVKSYIAVQFKILLRGHCSLLDFFYVFLGQLLIFILPTKVLKIVSNKLLRKSVKKTSGV